MPTLIELRKELRELRKTNSPRAVSQMRKDDLLMELERNRMMSKFLQHEVNTVEVSTPSAPVVEQVEKVEKKKTTVQKDTIQKAVEQKKLKKEQDLTRKKKTSL